MTRAALMAVLALLLGGCALLFVQKGGMRVESGTAAEVPTAPSLAGQIGEETRLSRHVVVAGDTLGGISRRYYGSSRHAEAIARANGMTLRTPLRIGRSLVIEPRGDAAKDPVSTTPQDPKVVRKTIGGQTYTLEVSGVGRKDRPTVNRAFAPGEYLRFIVKFFAVTGGYATLEVRDLVTHEKRPCYRLVGTAKAAFPFSQVCTVDEQLESLFDAVDFFPWSFRKKVVECRYHEDTSTVFHPLKHLAVRVKNQDPPKEHPIPPYVQDIISCFYYARLLKLEPGDKFAIPTLAGDKNYELVVEVLRRDTQRVQAGKFECLVVKPHVKYDNVFQNKGDVLLWVTDDERHLPILIRTKIVIGNIDVELIDARLPKISP